MVYNNDCQLAEIRRAIDERTIGGVDVRRHFEEALIDLLTKDPVLRLMSPRVRYEAVYSPQMRSVIVTLQDSVWGLTFTRRVHLCVLYEARDGEGVLELIVKGIVEGFLRHVREEE